MDDRDNQRPQPGFWGTLPGIITAIAGLLTAIGSLVAILYTVGPLSLGGPGPAETPVPQSPDGRGPAFVVPQVTGRNLDEAVAAIEARGLRVGDVRETPADEPAGTVIEQDPPPGNEVPEGTLVHLVLAAGAQPPDGMAPPNIIPEVTGQNVEKAVLAIEAAGLRVGEIQEVPATEPAGTIIEQDPPPGSEVPEGTSVRLVVSRGP